MGGPGGGAELLLLLLLLLLTLAMSLSKASLPLAVLRFSTTDCFPPAVYCKRARLAGTCWGKGTRTGGQQNVVKTTADGARHQ